jgi:DNA-binding IclR family transcriptional regulator
MNRANSVNSVLRLFTADKPLWTAEEAAAALDVSLSTAYRQLAALVKAGLLDAVEGSSAYVLGPAIIELDRNIRLSDSLIITAKPAMRWLADQAPVPCTILLCRLYRDRVMCIHQEEKTGNGGEVSYERGRLMPLFHGAPSKSILAQLPARKLAGIVGDLQDENSAAARQIPDLEDLRKELKQIRRLGYCITRGEVDEGIVGLAVPLPTARRGIAASLGIACFGSPSETDISRARALLVATSETIKASLDPQQG